ncbi:nucleolin-like [Wyeomyia smithii]|uniref:nucleolin-like n=1 Tax=Wyeomyia smithii TaxID=174621 RepID=UPI002467F605|nr:nucleolin-like [Wyeomyia smithii]
MAVKNKAQKSKTEKTAEKRKVPLPAPESEEEDEDLAEESDADEEMNEGSDQQVDDNSDEEDAAEPEVKPAAKQEEDVGTTVFVGHIKYDATKEELAEFFAKAGEVKDVRIIKNRGYAFIKFADLAGVEKALKLDNEMLGGRKVHVEHAKPKKTDGEKKKKKRKAKKQEDDDEPKAKQAKLSPEAGKTAGPKKGKPKQQQAKNPNKKKNKTKPGQFVKAK